MCTVQGGKSGFLKVTSSKFPHTLRMIRGRPQASHGVLPVVLQTSVSLREYVCLYFNKMMLELIKPWLVYNIVKSSWKNFNILQSPCLKLAVSTQKQEVHFDKQKKKKQTNLLIVHA